MVDEENLEAKDYVKVFLSPLMPSPTFGTLVDMVDQVQQGNYGEAPYMTQSMPVAITVGGVRFLDAVTGSKHIREFVKGLHVLNFNNYYKKFIEFYDEIMMKFFQAFFSQPHKLR